MMYILVLESSTTSAKAMLYDTCGKTCQVRSQAYRLRSDDVTVHDAVDVFESTVGLGRELAAGKTVEAVALSGTWHSVMLCDRDMNPRTPIYLWSHTGAAALCKELRGDQDYVRAFYRKTGCMVNAIYPFFKLKLLAQEGYDLTKYNILGQGTYNTYRLTGEWVVTDSVASGTGLLDIHKKVFDQELLRELGIGASQLGRLVTSRDAFPLSDEGAALLGQKAGIPVIPTMPDGALNQIGSGAMQDGVMTFSVGTSGAIRLTTQNPVIPDIPSTWCYVGAGAWLSGAAISGCCNCVDWFKKRISTGDIGYGELDRGAAQAGDETPIFLPFLFGERCPGWNDARSSAFFDVKPAHTAFDLYRAVLEGVLYNMYQCYEVLREINGAPRKIKLSGGILSSPVWMQMCADIFEEEMETDTVAHASLQGGVFLLEQQLGLLDSLAGAPSGSGQIILPDPQAAPKYREKYQRYLHYYRMTQ